MDKAEEESLCKSCAACCKSYSYFTNDTDEALRLRWLRTDLIDVQHLKHGLYRVTLNIPCKHLGFDGGSYSCAKHEKVRPGFCETYPRNILEHVPEAVDDELQRCPLLKRLVEAKP